MPKGIYKRATSKRRTTRAATRRTTTKRMSPRGKGKGKRAR